MDHHYEMSKHEQINYISIYNTYKKMSGQEKQ